MTITTHIKFVTLLVLSIFVFSLATQAQADHGADPEPRGAAAVSAADTAQIAQMQALIELLLELLEKLQNEKGMDTAMSHIDDDHGHSHDHGHGASDELQIWVELHSNETHVHVIEPGEDEDSFFLDIEYTDEDAIIDAVADETGLSVDEVADAIVFPTGEVNERGDTVHEHDGDGYSEEELEGIHIMGNGDVMLGDGTVLPDASIMDDGMIQLSDGTIVTPKFDLR